MATKPDPRYWRRFGILSDLTSDEDAGRAELFEILTTPPPSSVWLAVKRRLRTTSPTRAWGITFPSAVVMETIHASGETAMTMRPAHDLSSKAIP